MTFKKIFLAICIFSLTSCVSIPPVLQGDFSSLTPAASKQQHPMNVPIRWSGLIINTVNRKDKTCFEIVQTQTNDSLRPVKVIPKESSRFLACKDGFMEPHAFNKRLVTITGQLVAYSKQNIGEYEYEYPVVKTDKIYIWRKNVPRYNYFNNFASFSPFYCHRSYLSGYCF